MNLAEGTIYRRVNYAAMSPVAAEMATRKRAVVLSASDWAIDFKAAAMAPITSEFPDHNRGGQKVVFRSVKLEQQESGQDRRGLILVSQFHTLTQEDIQRLLATHNAELDDNRLSLDRLAQARLYLRDLLITGSGNTLRYPHEIGPITLRAGDVVQMREYGASGMDRTDPARNVREVRPWVVVSSDLWLELLSSAAIHTQRLGGLVRSLIAVAPLFPPGTKQQITVEVGGTQPGLPAGGTCRFHLVRTRSIARVASVEGAVDERTFRDVGAALGVFLGLS